MFCALFCFHFDSSSCPIDWVKHTHSHTLNQNQYSFSRQCHLNYKEEKNSQLLHHLFTQKLSYSELATHNTLNGTSGPSLHFLFPFWAPLAFLPEIRQRYIAEPHSLWQALLGSRTPVFPAPFFLSSLTMNFKSPCTGGAWEAQFWPVRYEGVLLANVWEWHCAPDKNDRYKRRVCQWVLPPSSCFEHRFHA